MEPGEGHICWSVRACPHLIAEPCPETRLLRDICSVCPLFIGSVAEPDAATMTAETLALQRLPAGPSHSLTFALLRRGSARGLKLTLPADIQLTSKASRFRVASQSAS